MSDKLRRRAWYDGWFYAWFIDSNFTSFRNRIFKYIEPDKRLIDIGCGTGGFTMKMAQTSKYVLGVDISEKQVAIAQKRLSRAGLQNVEFLHINAAHLEKQINEKFDYAILTFIVHEVQHSERLSILAEVKKVADKILILDYYHPMAKNFSGYIIRLTELFAGRDHYKNFLDYNKRGGLPPLLEKSGLEILQDRINKPRVFRTVITVNKT
jgi:SAM-dependent methyltransferase